MPKISVVVTTYNRSELLRETVSSILSQTFTDFELIVVDNYSNYNFLELIGSFNDERIKAYQNVNNGIIAINRNYGIKLAAGEYIALCDDDDLWEPTKLEDQLSVMVRNPSVSVCCTNVTFINFRQKQTTFSKLSGFLRGKFLSFNVVPAKYLLIFLAYVTNSSVLFRRELVNLIGYINEDPDLKAIEDYEYWFRSALVGKVFYINKRLVRYRLHDQQLSLMDSNVYKRTLGVVRSQWSKLNAIQKMIYKIKNGQQNT
ncbi:Glycosyltransferase, GT2 family [Pedobacter steynii]|uniref:Glycosyltransferase, GT2 family n=2 Tax=Pedobacter steynii TaxID=430522 RepID=A0A1G9WIG3_9SPHI|nr:Glycosyltransferase, GT2 family [Pedobacter steynii]